MRLIKHYHPTTYLVYSLVALTLLSGFILSNASNTSHLASATTSDLRASQASVTVKATCSIVADVDTAHEATLLNGQYSSGVGGLYPDGIGKTNFSVLCNDTGGFDIYVAGYTNNAIGNNVLTNPSINVNNNNYDIASGTATSGDTSNWAMKINQVTGEGQTPPTLTDDFDDDAYVTVPNEYKRLAYYTSNTNAAVGSSTISATYAAYISPNQPAGTYSGQVAYMLVHPTDGSVQTDFYSMQNIAAWKNDLTLGQEVTAYDMRDGKAYTVAKLCTDINYNNGINDTPCNETQIWMTENLDLEIDNTRTYTHADTDLGWSSEPYNTGATWAPTATKATSITFPATSGNGSVAGWSGSSNTNAYWADGIDASGNEIYNYQGSKFVGIDACMNSTYHLTEAQCKHYHVGNYYNWSAAVASNNTSGYGDADKYTVVSGSICPAGWRLPNGLTKDSNDDVIMSDFNKLLKAYNITGTGGKDETGTATTNGIDLYGGASIGWGSNGYNNIGLAPLYFVRSGNLLGSMLYDFGQNGYYWSSTVSSSLYAYSLRYGVGGLRPADQDSRNLGRSVRCIAR